MTPPITAALLGAGRRGYYVYGPYALEHPDELRFVAVAEPNRERRERFAEAHGIPPARRFESWDQLLDAGKLATDVQYDRGSDPRLLTLAAIAAGYDVLLEKPMATRVVDVVALVQAAERAGRLFQIFTFCATRPSSPRCTRCSPPAAWATSSPSSTVRMWPCTWPTASCAATGETLATPVERRCNRFYSRHLQNARQLI